MRGDLISANKGNLWHIVFILNFFNLLVIFSESKKKVSQCLYNTSIYCLIFNLKHNFNLTCSIVLAALLM